MQYFSNPFTGGITSIGSPEFQQMLHQIRRDPSAISGNLRNALIQAGYLQGDAVSTAPSPAAGAMPLAPAPTALQAGAAVGTGSAYGGGAGGGPSSASLLQSAAATADPWAAQRAQYQTQLNNLMQGGVSAVASDPSVQARQQAGEQTLARSMAARGFLGSGNILQELQKQGQDIASQEYGNQFSRLAMLAGVNAGSPTSSAGILAQIPGQQLAEQQVGFNQAVQTQRLPYELTALQNAALQGQQQTEAGGLQNQLLQQQMQQMRDAQNRLSLIQQQSAMPRGFLA
jgi:hypothetical protein